MYIAATTLLTLTTTLYHPPAQSYISSTTQPRDRARALGIFNAGGTFGVSLGPLSVSVLMGVLAFQWRQIYGLWALPILLGLVTLLFVKDPSEVVKRRASEEWDEGETVETLLNPNMIVFLLSSTIRRFGGGLTTGFLTIWLAESQGWTVAQMGVMYSVSSMLGLVASPIGGEMASRFGEKRWLVATLFASYTCFVAAIALKGFWPFLVFYLGQRFFGILGMPGSIALTARLSPPRQRGMGFALSSVPGSIFGSLASIIAAYIADLYGLYPIFIVAAAIYYIGCGVLQFGVKLD
jgi:MFS family permease